MFCFVSVVNLRAGATKVHADGKFLIEFSRSRRFWYRKRIYCASTTHFLRSEHPCCAAVKPNEHSDDLDASKTTSTTNLQLVMTIEQTSDRRRASASVCCELLLL
ncbi:unnamed protein product [Amoebophrya sp. A120]|nr:unnamed protein product [Amoebophrya sp. A120]|eukprot:GSA120T00008957001.1